VEAVLTALPVSGIVLSPRARQWLAGPPSARGICDKGGRSPGAAAVGVPDEFAPARLGPITVRNRTIKAATYENLARRGQVTDELIDFHVRQGAGSAQPLPFPPRQTVLL